MFEGKIFFDTSRWFRRLLAVERFVSYLISSEGNFKFESHLKNRFWDENFVIEKRFQLASQSVWWSHLMKILIVFMIHISFYLKKGSDDESMQVWTSRRTFAPPRRTRTTIKLWIRYLELYDSNLLTNCFMKLSCLWRNSVFERVQWTPKKIHSIIFLKRKILSWRFCNPTR